MRLKAIVSTIDDIDERYRDLYAEGDSEGNESGKWVLQVEATEGYAMENVTGLRNALAEEREKARKGKELLTRFEGIDPGDIEKLRTDNDRLRKKAEKGFSREEIEREARETVGAQWKKKVDDLEAKYTADVGSRDTELEKLYVDNTLTEAITTAGGNVPLLMPHAKSRVRCRRDAEGKMVVETLDSSGNPGVGGADSPRTIVELVDGMKGDSSFRVCFAGSGASGSGAPADAARANEAQGSGTPKHKSDFNGDDAAKATWVRENGLAAFDALPKAPTSGQQGASA